MRRILPLILLLTALTAVAEQKYPPAPKFMTDITYKVDTDKGRGSAFAVDLSPFGMPGRSYMITAAHVVLIDKTKDDAYKTVRIETKEPNFKKRRWVKVEVVAIDIKLDVAILKAGFEFEHLGTIAMKDLIEVNDQVAVTGHPLGAPLAISFGYLGDKVIDVPNMLNENWWFASAPVFEGNSGGPVFDPNREEIIGVLVICLRTEHGTAPNACGFVSTPCIRKFVEKTSKMLAKNAKK